MKKKATPIICVLLLVHATVLMAQTKKGIFEVGAQIGSAGATGKPSFMYEDGSSSLSLFFYRHQFFSQTWGISVGGAFQRIASSSNVRFEETGGQTVVALMPASYQFNELAFDYFTVPVLASFIPFQKNNRAVAIRLGPTIGFLMNTTEKAFVNGSSQHISMASGRPVKADLHFEVSTLTLPGVKNRVPVNVGFGLSYQLNNFTADANGFGAFCGFFKLGFQF